MRHRIVSHVLACLLAVGCAQQSTVIPIVDSGMPPIVTGSCVDNDGDGVPGTGNCSKVAVVDCDDGDPHRYPGAVERCNGIDDNCDGKIDEGVPTQSYYVDADGDGYGSSSSIAQVSCAPVVGKVTNNTDCDDTNNAVHPGAVELCNHIDDNCNGAIDEGNPGGGVACSTGQMGICAAGLTACQAGAISCVRVHNPVAEICNGLDDNCNGPADETFTTLGVACNVGVGVCNRTGINVCNSSGNGVACNATAGSPTASACDGLDNNCDGRVDEPVLTSTTDIATGTPWLDVEVAPYYFSPASCAGGTNPSGVDVLAGGAAIYGVGANGIFYQRLDTSGVPVGSPVNVVVALPYVDVALAQAGDGFMVVGLYKSPVSAIAINIDVYYVDALSGSRRTFTFSLFPTSTSIDSLRLVRGGGKRVTMIWREVGVGLHYAQLEPIFDSTNSLWNIRGPGDTNIVSGTIVSSSTLPAGIGADSNEPDWGPSITCIPAAHLATVAVAYMSSNQGTVNYLTVNEDGTSPSSVSALRTDAVRTFYEPEVAYFKDSGGTDQFMSAWTSKNTTAMDSNVEFRASNMSNYGSAYAANAVQNGSNSIERPRLSVTAGGMQLTALRYVNDTSTFKKQIMTRRLDLTGNKVPTSTAVEFSATAGSCQPSDMVCRAGDKAGLTNWAQAGRIYMVSSDASTSLVSTSALGCN